MRVTDNPDGTTTEVDTFTGSTVLKADGTGRPLVVDAGRVSFFITYRTDDPEQTIIDSGPAGSSGRHPAPLGNDALCAVLLPALS